MARIDWEALRKEQRTGDAVKAGNVIVVTQEMAIRPDPTSEDIWHTPWQYKLRIHNLMNYNEMQQLGFAKRAVVMLNLERGQSLALAEKIIGCFGQKSLECLDETAKGFGEIVINTFGVAAIPKEAYSLLLSVKAVSHATTTDEIMKLPDDIEAVKNWMAVCALLSDKGGE